MRCLSFMVTAIALRAHALAPRIPRVTDAAQADKAILASSLSHWTTQAPYEAELRKRQQHVIEYLAPDNTCGYIDGVASEEIGCPSTATCAGLVSVPALVCCNDYGCREEPLKCYDYTKWLSASGRATTALWCSDTSSPYCNGYTIPGLSKSVLLCTTSSQPLSVWNDLETTTDGDTKTALWQTLSPTTSGPSSSSPISSSSSSSTSSSPTQVVPPPPTEKDPPIAAIVGGVVGGIAVLAALVGGVLFYLYKKKKAATVNNNPDYNLGSHSVAPSNPPPRDGAMSPAAISQVSDPRISQAPTLLQYQRYAGKTDNVKVAELEDGSVTLTPPMSQAVPVVGTSPSIGRMPVFTPPESHIGELYDSYPVPNQSYPAPNQSYPMPNQNIPVSPQHAGNPIY